MSKTGIVNVRMVITEEKIISNIDKVQKMINPKSKKQIIQLEEDTYFKDLIESIKNYLVEYPKKKSFPPSVYNAAYGLVEYAINRFEENTKKVEELIKKREANIALADSLSELVNAVDTKQAGWKELVEKNEYGFSEDIIEALNVIGRCKGKTSQKYKDNMKILKAKVNNLESNLHIEIDMERLEDSSKALSFIGIEISDALKLIPAPEDKVVEKVEEKETKKTTKVQEISEEDEEEDIPKVQQASEKRVFKRKRTPKVPVQAIENQKTEETKQENIEKVEKQKNVEKIAKNEKAKKLAEKKVIEETTNEENEGLIEEYNQATTFDVKPSLWQRFKNSKLVRAATFIFRIKIRIEIPSNALPEGNGENNYK